MNDTDQAIRLSGFIDDGGMTKFVVRGPSVEACIKKLCRAFPRIGFATIHFD